MNLDLSLKQANIDDAEEINSLINLAYRGNDGWTKETDIVEGERSNIEDVNYLIKNQNTYLLTAKTDGDLVACICIEEKENKAYIGSFAVSPDQQNIGVGKKILELAEKYASKKLGVTEFVMVVISQRKELIEFYERRGYKRTGKIDNYPVYLNVGVPSVKGLTIEYLAKNTYKLARGQP
ncbi:MAG: GNAT family N-acetyltransferase [Methylococcales bacterium]|nr:GNAT family N-acetyltransferase [Methylococcales bacterium]